VVYLGHVKKNKRRIKMATQEQKKPDGQIDALLLAAMAKTDEADAEMKRLLVLAKQQKNHIQWLQSVKPSVFFESLSVDYANSPTLACADNLKVRLSAVDALEPAKKVMVEMPGPEEGTSISVTVEGCNLYTMLKMFATAYDKGKHHFYSLTNWPEKPD
jgi:hypothetical protein